METSAYIRCPHCGVIPEQVVPADACQVISVYTSCGRVLQPKAGDDCVFCSYADCPCPPIQPASAGMARRVSQ